MAWQEHFSCRALASSSGFVVHRFSFSPSLLTDLFPPTLPSHTVPNSCSVKDGALIQDCRLALGLASALFLQAGHLSLKLTNALPDIWAGLALYLLGRPIRTVLVQHPSWRSLRPAFVLDCLTLREPLGFTLGFTIIHAFGTSMSSFFVDSTARESWWQPGMPEMFSCHTPLLSSWSLQRIPVASSVWDAP